MVFFFSHSQSQLPRLPTTSLQVFLAQRPVQHITPDTFGIRHQPLPDLHTVLPSKLVVKVLYVSCDPAMRSWLRERKSYIEPQALGAKMRAMGVGEVVRAAPGFRVGHIVTGPFGWTEYCIVDVKHVTIVNVPAAVPASAALGVLGLTGLTAYFGVLYVDKPKKGNTVVVSAAAGATGSIVAQIAKNVIGCHVVGIAGGLEKCRYLENELGISSVDYKSEEGVYAGLKRALEGRGVDFYFDNVGGQVLDTVLHFINRDAKIVLCGAISSYNSKTLPPGPSNYTALIEKRATMTGFLVFDYEKLYSQARNQLSKWLSSGKIKMREYEVIGLKNAPDGLKALFEGKNIGKVVVRVFEDEQTDVNQEAEKSRHAKL